MNNDELLASVAEHCTARYAFGEESGHLCTEAERCPFAKIVAAHVCKGDCYPCFVRVARDYVLNGPPDLPVYKKGYWDDLAKSPDREDEAETDEEEEREEEVALGDDASTVEWEMYLGDDD